MRRRLLDEIDQLIVKNENQVEMPTSENVG
jgi:hypothetical protein